MKKINVMIAILFLSVSRLSGAAEPLKFAVMGVEGDAKQNVMALLTAEALLPTNAHDFKQFSKHVPTLVQQALEPFGYFRASTQSQLTFTNHHPLLSLIINPGPALYISDVDFQLQGMGKNDPIFQKILTPFPLRATQQFSVEKYEGLKKNLHYAALQNGYFDSKITAAEIKIDLVRYTATIKLHYDTGERYRFGQIVFNKNPYATQFLKRFAEFTPGDYYDAKKIQKFQENLSSSDYFKEVIIDPKTEASMDKQVPIDVNLLTLMRREIDLGLGYGTDTGPRAVVNYTARQLTPDGQLFKTQIQASRVYSNAQANYIIPGANPATDKYILSAAVQQLVIPPGTSYLEKIAASYTNAMAGLQQVIALALQHERWALTGQPYQSEVLLVPSINWSKIYRNDDIKPSKGYRANLGIVGSPPFGHDASFLQAKFNAKAIYPVFNFGEILGRIDLGYTLTNDISRVPLSFNFFAGGTESIRGYQFDYIGPGTDLFVISGEYRQKIKNDWYLATFIDAGNASNAFPGTLKKGVGLGPVWKSPVGTIELTVAKGLDDSGHAFMIQFSMGPDI